VAVRSPIPSELFPDPQISSNRHKCGSGHSAVTFRNSVDSIGYSASAMTGSSDARNLAGGIRKTVRESRAQPWLTSFLCAASKGPEYVPTSGGLSLDATDTSARQACRAVSSGRKHGTTKPIANRPQDAILPHVWNQQLAACLLESVCATTAWLLAGLLLLLGFLLCLLFGFQSVLEVGLGRGEVLLVLFGCLGKVGPLAI